MKKIFILFTLILFAHCYNNGYGLKPILGWNTWCAVGECGLDLCTEKQIKETADAMVNNGMKKVGYEWIILDDCWHPTRDSEGVLVPNNDFPNGMKSLADYVHNLGLKFGLYTSAGSLTCKGDVGSYGHFTDDANTFASWGIDYVKMDWCGNNLNYENHIAFGLALNATGRPIWLELCRGTYQHQGHYGYAFNCSQSWRATGDHHDNFASTLSQVKSVEGRSSWYGPYGWAYLDMMMTGGQGCKGQSADQALHCPGQNDNQYRTEFSLYAILASPLIAGTDIRNMTDIMKECLLNTEIIAVNQDYSVPPGDTKLSCGITSYVRKLSDGTVAVVIPNLINEKKQFSVCFKDIGWNATTASVRDLWAHKDLGSFTTQFTTSVNAYDSLFIILK